jgi:rod shape-determining protein MreC
MLRKPHLILLAILAFCVVVLLALPEHTRSRVRVALSTVFLPLFGLAGSAQAAAERAAAALTPRSALLAQVEALEAENDRLRQTVAELEATQRGMDELMRMVGYARRTPWKLQPAHVIGRDPSSWWRSVHLDVGWRDGVTNNLAVLTPEGLVGRVAEVGPWTCRVVLIGDPNCPVAAALVDSGETGIIRGAAGGDIHGEFVELSFLSRNAAVRPGQQVITSGQGGVFPRGIPLGEVVEARSVGHGIYLEARVRLAVNLGVLHRVWVKLP